MTFKKKRKDGDEKKIWNLPLLVYYNNDKEYYLYANISLKCNEELNNLIYECSDIRS
uniref:Uncharacterized protein n=1 Tax=Rhizophagus irregularis (strain DAOM 181602 / DAOM 197198 / MUCL 43194) TaxID=747089 RepID=U9T3M8_RHIID